MVRRRARRADPGPAGSARAPSVASSALPGPRGESGGEAAERAAGMFRKARRVNVRKRNDSEEEERERDEEPEPPAPPPPPGSGEEQGAGGGDRAPGGEALLGPGPPPAALTPGPAPEAGGCFPGGAEPGNGLKPRKRPRENKEVPRASLLSFQDEEEETEEVFKVKKSSYSKKIVKLLKKEYKEDLEKSKIKTELNSSADNEPPLDKTGHVKDPSQEDGVVISEHGEDEMDMESEKEEEKPKAGGAFSNALSSLNVLRPGAPLLARVGTCKV